MSDYNEDIYFANLGEVIIEEPDDDELCPLCAKPLVLRVTEYNRFFSCSNYPWCNGKREY